MTDSFKEVSHESWLGRIGNSIKGIVFGLILFVVAFPVLFWNEGRAVERFKTLKEGAGAVLSVRAESVDPVNDGKLIHLSGEATTTDPVVDPDFGLSVDGLKLRRKVEIYQWKESSRSETKKNVGGSSTTETTYSYTKQWVDDPIDSSRFRKPAGHTNTGTLPVNDTTVTADPITVGAYELNSGLKGKLNFYEDYRVANEFNLPAAFASAKISSGQIYVAANPSTPEIGDVRVSFSVVPEGPVSLISRQVGNTFEAYLAKAGGTIELLQSGTHSADAMFEKAQADNRIMTWILRGVGFFLMGIGLSLMLKPLSVVADVLPFIGNIVEAGTGFIAFLIAFGFSFITIAIAWLFYRPLLGGALLVLGIAAFVMMGGKLQKAKAKRKAAVVS